MRKKDKANMEKKILKSQICKNASKKGNYRIPSFDIKNRSLDYLHLINTYKNHVNSNSLVVEIGASNIHRTHLLSIHCKHLTGVEFFLERLLANFDNVIYKQGDWQNLDKILQDDSFDILVSSQCIEHIPDDLAAINETYRLLKKGGVAIINTPNKKRLIRMIIELFAGRRKFPWWEHIREYSKEDLINLIKQSKFKNYKIEPVCFGIKSRKYLCLKNCPRFLENLCVHWEIILYK